MLKRGKVPAVEFAGKAVKVRPHALVCDGPVVVQQGFRDECDINKIVARFKSPDLIPRVKSAPQYLDLASAVDFLEAASVTARANSAFASLPADVRQRFNNDPALMLEFLDDPKNGAQAVAWGLATLRPKPADASPPQAAAAAPGSGAGAPGSGSMKPAEPLKGGS